MQNMLSPQYRMPHHPPQEILEQPFPPGDHRRILLRFTLTLDGVVRQALLIRYRGDDQDRIQSGQRLMERQK